MMRSIQAFVIMIPAMVGVWFGGVARPERGLTPVAAPRAQAAVRACGVSPGHALSGRTASDRIDFGADRN